MHNFANSSCLVLKNHNFSIEAKLSFQKNFSQVYKRLNDFLIVDNYER